MSQERSATIASCNGIPTLLLDGKPREFLSCKIAESIYTEKVLDMIPREVPPLLRQGIRLFWIPIFVNWKGPGDYDFSDMDARINTFIRTVETTIPEDSAQIALGIRIQAAVFSPEWYIKSSFQNGTFANLVKFRNLWGDAEPVPTAPSMRFHTANTQGFFSTCAISPGDPFWDTHAPDCLQAVINHARSQSYHRYVFAYLPCAFNSNEWFLTTRSPEACCDFSAPAEKAFSNYLKARGIDAPENPVPPPEICFPHPGASLIGTTGASQENELSDLLDPSRPEERLVEEFSLWLNGRIAEIICNLASVIKRNYQEKPKLAGFFYGYNLQLSSMNHLSQSGHLGLRKALNSPDVDFLCSPCLYTYRNEMLSCQFSSLNGAYTDAARLYGKLLFAEDDHHPSEFRVSGECRDDWHDQMAFRRNFAMAASHNINLWHYSLGCGWLLPEHRRTCIAELYRIARELNTADRSPVAEVAVVVDERSVSAMTLNPALQKALLLESVAAVAQSGAAFDLYELESFFAADHARYQFVIFCNLIRSDAEILAEIRRLRSGNRTLFFQSAAGYRFDTEHVSTFSALNASELTGIRLREVSRQPLVVWCDPDRFQLPENLQKDIRYGLKDRRHTPVLGVDDSEAELFGTLPDGSAGLARRTPGQYHVIYSAAPAIDPQLLNGFYRQAGVFCRTPAGAVVYENGAMLAISAAQRGSLSVAMHPGEQLKEAFTGEIISQESAGTIQRWMKRHETTIFLKKKVN